MASGNLLRRLRMSALLYVLIMVAVGAWLARTWSTDWNDTLWVAVHPFNGDASTASARYIERLHEGSFDEVERYVAAQASRYGVSLDEPVRIELKSTLAEGPPQPPADRNVPGVMWWSLKLRWWDWRLDDEGPVADITLVMIYHDPERHAVLPHSLGLQKGLIGIVNAYARADQAGPNRVVLAHELMHTLGATDKYDPATSLPAYPAGYAEPDRVPLYPQTHAELMGGRIPESESRADMPVSLADTLIGPATAREIRWLEAP